MDGETEKSAILEKKIKVSTQKKGLGNNAFKLWKRAHFTISAVINSESLCQVLSMWE